MRTTALALCVAASCVVACATDDTQPDSGSTGRLSASLTMPALGHDVAHFMVRVVPAGADCTADPVVPPAIVDLEDEYLPLYLEPNPPGGAFHPFGDALFVLPPGLYTVCAQPLTATLEPSLECAATMTTEPVEVFAEATTEIVLFSQCAGDPKGGLDVVVALNDPPHIDDLALDPSKFITTCETVTVTVYASDPNGDALTYTWSLVDSPVGPAPLPLFGPSVTSPLPPIPGVYVVQVVVSDGHGGTASLTFPVHVSAGNCCGDGICAGGTGETCDSCEADCGPCPDLADCCSDHGPGGPGCGDAPCVDSVCAIDAYCCEVTWDQLCADEAADLCAACAPNDCADIVQPGTPCEGPATCDLPPTCCAPPFGYLCAGGSCECGPGDVWQCAEPTLICPEPCPDAQPNPGSPCTVSPGPIPYCEFGFLECPGSPSSPEAVCSCGPAGWDCFTIVCPPPPVECPVDPPTPGASCEGLGACVFGEVPCDDGTTAPAQLCECGPDGTWFCDPIGCPVPPAPCPVDQPADGSSCAPPPGGFCGYGEQTCPQGPIPATGCNCAPGGLWQCGIVLCAPPLCPLEMPPLLSPCGVDEGIICGYSGPNLCCGTDLPPVCPVPESAMACLDGLWQPAPPICAP
jgi:hypothetical protein